MDPRFLVDKLRGNESLKVIHDVFGNELQEIYVYNGNTFVNFDPDTWTAAHVKCFKCGTDFIERSVGMGYDPHFNEDQTFSETVVYLCPHCYNRFSIVTRTVPKTSIIAPSINESLNDAYEEMEGYEKDDE